MEYKVEKGQIIATTLADSQGEKLTIDELEEFFFNSTKRKRINIGQEHDFNNDYVGYLENFRIESLDGYDNEFCIKADAYVNKNASHHYRGFSWSLIKHFPNQNMNADFHIFLPYPLYNDNAFVNSLKAKNIALGSWKKKSADPNTIALICTGLFFVLAPGWDSLYKSRVEPKLKKILKKVHTHKSIKLHYDHIQTVVHPLGYKYKVYFINSNIPSGIDVQPFRFRYGLKAIEKYLNDNPQSRQIYMVKMIFTDDLQGFQIWCIEYANGNVEYLV